MLLYIMLLCLLNSLAKQSRFFLNRGISIRKAGVALSCHYSTFDSSVEEDYRTAVKELKKTNSPKKILKISQEMSETGKLNQNMTVFAFKTLQRMNRSDLSFAVMPLWHRTIETSEIELEPTSILLKSLCRMNRIDFAEDVAHKVGLLLNDNNSKITLGPLDRAAALLPDLILGYSSIGNFTKALSVLELLCQQSISFDNDLAKMIMKLFIQQSDSRSIRKALRLLLLMNTLYDYESTQLLTSIYMKSIEFLKGVVSMETMPPETIGEAAFMGRSNVGKSSLINMICNRKELAFTSKTPGKTSEFNYFHAKGSNTKFKEKHQFYLVDMPGVGYAEVKRSQKSIWLDLLRNYAASRGTLKVLFHLVDSRHGLLDADKECLSLLSVIPNHIQYVIVLTKVDKRGSGGNGRVVSRIKSELARYCSDSNVVTTSTLDSSINESNNIMINKRRIPIIQTSSQHKEGGALVWSVLLDSLAGDAPETFETLLKQPLVQEETLENSTSSSVPTESTADA